MRQLATGLAFPEGPVVLPDGSVLVVEMAAGTLTRVTPHGAVEIVAKLGGGPNGTALGPDGAAYVCNNGGYVVTQVDGVWRPADVRTRVSQPPDYSGGRIERVDLTTGEVSVLYTSCDGNALRGPNDIVFDSTGGFWFTDHGKRRERDQDRGGVYYARADGSSITEVVFPLEEPNGIGLSPGGDRLYVAESPTGRLFAWEIVEPGVLRTGRSGLPSAALVVGLPGWARFDSLAVEEDGTVVVGTFHGPQEACGLSAVRPDGSVEFHPMPDRFPTNLCFGGADMCTAYVTLSGSGRLVDVPWRRPGLPLAF